MHRDVMDMISINRQATPQELAWYDVSSEVAIAADGVPPGEHRLEFGAQWGDPVPVILDVSTRKPGKRQRNGRGVTIDVRDGFLVIGAKRGLTYYAMKHLESETSYREFAKLFQKADHVSDGFGVAPQSDPHAVMEEFRRVRGAGGRHGRRGGIRLSGAHGDGEAEKQRLRENKGQHREVAEEQQQERRDGLQQGARRRAREAPAPGRPLPAAQGGRGPPRRPPDRGRGRRGEPPGHAQGGGEDTRRKEARHLEGGHGRAAPPSSWRSGGASRTPWRRWRRGCS